MFDTYGPVRPALYMAKVIVERGHEVFMVSTTMSDTVQKLLKSYRLNPLDLSIKSIMRGRTSLSWLEFWAREAFLNLNSRGFSSNSDIVINFSYTVAVPATFWYAQGTTTDFLRDTEHWFPTHYKLVYRSLKPLLSFADNRLIKRIASISKLIIANSRFCASMYTKRRIKVHNIVYPPLDCNAFRPTSTPSSNYILTYFGKETEFCVLKRIGDANVKIKAFGSKAPYIPRSLLEHKNIEFLGRVSDEELTNLYSNALFTLFTFTHEPFGYIPVESMACGTPVLTYNRQGPSETVIDHVTGWLVNTNEEMASLALRLWKKGYPSTMRKEARKRALIFNVTDIAEKWLQLIKGTTMK